MSKRTGLSLAVINGKMLAVGGRDDEDFLKTVEEFNEEAGAWEVGDPMNIPRAGGGVGVIKMMV